MPTLAESFFLLPMTILAIFSCIPITIKVMRGNYEPSNQQTLMISVFGIILSGAAVILQGQGASQTVFSGALIFDKMAIYSDIGILIISGFTLFLSYSGVNSKGESFAEHVFLILMSAVGMLTMTSAGDLIVSFVGLEIMSVALYVLIGLGHEQQLSKEAAFKYFILGSFASAIFLYGVALLFGTTGSTALSTIATQAVVLSATSRLFTLGIVLLIAGIGFKVSLFPFHAWTPDVYQGAPTSISAFMATGVKLVMFTLLLRLASLHILSGNGSLIVVLQVLAVLTMTFGNITAIMQDNIKRLLAYSSIAHAGYIMVGIIVTATTRNSDAGAATLFYLLVYSVMNIGAFAVVNVFEKAERGNLSVSDYGGLGFAYPMLGVAFSTFMLSLAGIPPTGGFIGKFYIFAAAIKDGYIALAIFGVINSLLSVYYYLRVLIYLYMKEQEYEVCPTKGFSSRFVIVATMALILIMGIASTPFYEPAMKSVMALF